MAELQGHMEHNTKADKALCGEPDAYIIDVGFTLDVDERGPMYWGVSCERCIAKIIKMVSLKEVAENGGASN